MSMLIIMICLFFLEKPITKLSILFLLRGTDSFDQFIGSLLKSVYINTLFVVVFWVFFNGEYSFAIMWYATCMYITLIFIDYENIKINYQKIKGSIA